MPKFKNQKGVTLIELMMTMLISSIVVLSMGILLADNLRGWRVMYGRVHSLEADNTYVTRLLFDKAVRKSSCDPGNIIFGTSPLSLTVYYYSDSAIKGPTNTPPDSYATFTYTNNQLTVSDTSPDSGGTPTTSTWVVPNVGGCVFQRGGRALQMVLVLNNPNNPADNRPQTFTVFSSAYLHSR